MPSPVLLNSSGTFNEKNRYDIITANPYKTFKANEFLTEIHGNGSSPIASDEELFELLEKHMPKPFSIGADLPFIGGIIGYFSYDFSRQLENLPTIAKNDLQLPEAILGFYDWAIINDHYLEQTWLIGGTQKQFSKNEYQQIKLRLKASTALLKTSFKLGKYLSSNMDKNTYAKAFSKCQHYIRNGESYQINLSQRFQTPCSGSSWGLYKLLCKKNPTPFSAYLQYADFRILSFSPERFLQLHNNKLSAEPIKGTKSRHPNPVEDAEALSNFCSDPKEMAENLMIVDLLRNDLSKACQLGTINVEKLFSPESFRDVHHLVSKISGIIKTSCSASTAFKYCFPGGSITGAPKIQTMKIIEELEPHRRGIYCGNIVYFSFSGNMDSNIMIRTLLETQGNIYCSTGSAITADSHMEKEYQETLDKIRFLFEAVEKYSPSTHVANAYQHWF